MRFDADVVCSEESGTACRDALRVASGVDDGPIERHSVRVFFIMERLAQQVSVTFDREVALCAALLHDIGLYDPAARPRFYLASGRASAKRLVESFGWPPARQRRCLDAIELHHRLRPQWDVGQEVELLRLADLVDGSRGLVRLGLQSAWLRDLFRSIARDGLQRELLRHSLRGAPCMSRALAGILSNSFRRSLPATPTRP